MRLESNGREGTFNVWMTDDELEELRRAAQTHRNDLIIQLGGYVGLRAFEIAQIAPRPVKRPEDGAHYHLRVPHGKDTQNRTGNPRDANLPDAVERDLHRYITAESI